jgi:hypothetical protein
MAYKDTLKRNNSGKENLNYFSIYNIPIVFGPQ